MSAVSETYAYVFSRFRAFAAAMAEDGLQDWKALLFLSVFQGAVLYAIMVLIAEWTSALSYYFVTSSKLGLTVAVVLVTFNYRLLLHKDRWRRYETIFRRYSKSRQRWSDALIVIGIAGVIALFVISVMSITPIRPAT